jgi:hypothetical protein
MGEITGLEKPQEFSEEAVDVVLMVLLQNPD